MRLRTQSSKIELLRRVSLFGSCTLKELRAVASLVDEIEVPEGEVLAREGATGKEFFVIAQGTAEVSRQGAQVASLGPGSFFGEISLLDGGPRTATIRATTPMHLLVVDSPSLSRLLNETPSVALKMLRELARRLRAAEDSALH